jgi:hypothetical protein
MRTLLELREYDRKYRDKNRQKINARKRISSKIHYGKNIEKLREQRRVHRLKHIERFRERDRLRKNTDQYRKSAREGRSRLIKTNLNFRIRTNLGSRLCHLLKGTRKSKPFLALLGCSIDNLKIYLESKFEPNMSWQNFGTAWEIDHIMPCAIFDLTIPGHQQRCFHFSNLQPLPKSENRSKKDRVLSNQFQLL